MFFTQQKRAFPSSFCLSYFCNQYTTRFIFKTHASACYFRLPVYFSCGTRQDYEENTHKTHFKVIKNHFCHQHFVIPHKVTEKFLVGDYELLKKMKI